MDESKKVETRRDSDGTILIRGKCSACKQCWIRLSSPNKGKCVYGGPFEGYTKVNDNATGRDKEPASQESG